MIDGLKKLWSKTWSISTSLMSLNFVPAALHNGWNDLVQKDESLHSLDNEVENGKDAEVLNPGPF